MVEARTRHIELSCVGFGLCLERLARIMVDAEQKLSPKEVRMKLHTLAASSVLAAALLSSAALPAAAKEECC